MANNTPILDLISLPTSNLKFISIGDASLYPSGWNINTPTLQITPPGYSTITQTFTARGIQIYNAYTLGIYTNDSIECNFPALPDGIYTFKYTITPANVYNVTKQFLRTDQIEADLDYAFLKLEIMECNGMVKKQKKETINLIEYYIKGAIASANKCALKQATELYNMAKKLLDNFIANIDCNC